MRPSCSSRIANSASVRSVIISSSPRYCRPLESTPAIQGTRLVCEQAIRLGIFVDGVLVGHDDRILALLHVVLIRAGLPLDVIGILEVLVLLLEVVDLGLRGLDLLVERGDLLSLLERRIQRSEESEE